MNKIYPRVDWKNYPDTRTPLNEHNLNVMDIAIDKLDDRIISLDLSKANQSDLYNSVKSTLFDTTTGILTIEYWNGVINTYNTGLDKLAVNFDYDPETEQLVLTLQDGTKKYIDMSALITIYEFFDSDTIAFEITDGGAVSAKVKRGSINADYLEVDYLANITEQANIADQAMRNAELYRNESSEYADESKGAEDEIRKMLRLSEFHLDDNGCLIYTNETSYNFEVNDEGNLIWEVIA